MERQLQPAARALLRTSIEAGDPTVDVYLDCETLHVVKVRDGRCSPGDLIAGDVENDEERFAEIPVVTTTEEFLWMQEFVEAYGNKRVAHFLDGRKGANQRFLKRLVKQTPDALAAWQAFRTARVDELCAEWLAELGFPDAVSADSDAGVAADPA